jgi:hypothetical protein
LFPEHAYVNLEPSDNREFAQQDPRGFLARYNAGAVIDEIQHAPELTSYLQAIVDDDPAPGRFILTGFREPDSSPNRSRSRWRVAAAWPGYCHSQLPRWPRQASWKIGSGITFCEGATRASWTGGWPLAELPKARLNAGPPGDLKHFRESRGPEIDTLIEDGLRLTAVECKSGATVHGDQVSGLQRFQKLLGDRAPELPAPELALAYGGTESVRRGGVAVTAWQDVGSIVDRVASLPDHQGGAR